MSPNKKMATMHRLLHIGFAFPGVPKVRDLEPGMTAVGDWVRYSPVSWLVWTDKPASLVYGVLRSYLDPADQILIAKIDPTESVGYLSPWIWEWINSKFANQQIVSGPPLDGLTRLKP